MSAMVLNLNNIEQGADWSQVITLDPVVDLTGYTGTCQIRSTASADSPVVASPTVTLDADPTLGKFTLALAAVDTSRIPVTYTTAYSVLTPYQYDVKMTHGVSGAVLRVLNGRVSVSPQVTRA